MHKWWLLHGFVCEEEAISSGEGGGSGGDNPPADPPKSALGNLPKGGEGGDNPPAEVDFDKLTADDYLNADETYDEETRAFLKDGFADVFKANKVAPETAKAILKAYNDKMAAAYQKNNEALEAGAKKAFEGWTENDRALVSAAFDHYAPEGSQFREALSTTNLGNDPHVLALLKAAGAAVKRDNGAGAGAPASGGTVPLAKQLGIRI